MLSSTVISIRQQHRTERSKLLKLERKAEYCIFFLFLVDTVFTVLLIGSYFQMRKLEKPTLDGGFTCVMTYQHVLLILNNSFALWSVVSMKKKYLEIAWMATYVFGFIRLFDAIGMLIWANDIKKLIEKPENVKNLFWGVIISVSFCFYVQKWVLQSAIWNIGKLLQQQENEETPESQENSDDPPPYEA